MSRELPLTVAATAANTNSNTANNPAANHDLQFVASDKMLYS